jgi:cellobiose-specific phosphotransferase system component IIA
VTHGQQTGTSKSCWQSEVDCAKRCKELAIKSDIESSTPVMVAAKHLYECTALLKMQAAHEKMKVSCLMFAGS